MHVIPHYGTFPQKQAFAYTYNQLVATVRMWLTQLPSIRAIVNGSVNKKTIFV
jgi:hypothetical protein